MNLTKVVPLLCGAFLILAAPSRATAQGNPGAVQSEPNAAWAAAINASASNIKSPPKAAKKGATKKKKGSTLLLGPKAEWAATITASASNVKSPPKKARKKSGKAK